jgi:membrane-bound lytic murein transglycosylase B
MTAPRLPLDRRRLLATLCIAAGAVPASATSQNSQKRRRPADAVPLTYATRPEALRWAEDVATRRDLPPGWTRDTIGQAVYLSNVPRLMLPPARGTAKNWRVYRGRFIDPLRIRAGARFWQRNRPRWRAPTTSSACRPRSSSASSAWKPSTARTWAAFACSTRWPR